MNKSKLIKIKESFHLLLIIHSQILNINIQKKEFKYEHPEELLKNFTIAV